MFGSEVLGGPEPIEEEERPAHCVVLDEVAELEERSDGPVGVVRVRGEGE